LDCPSCRKNLKVTKGQIANLPKNLALENIVFRYDLAFLFDGDRESHDEDEIYQDIDHNTKQSIVHNTKLLYFEICHYIAHKVR
jgi:hypothetical protein